MSTSTTGESGPMLFQISNPRNGKKTHCGVIEFSAEEGCAYLPYWMFPQLGLEEAQQVYITGVTLPKGTFVKFQPQDPEFLEISNPRAVSVSSYVAMTVGDVLRISYLDHEYALRVLELRPAPAVSLFFTDIQVDFAPPPGMDENGQFIGAARRPTPTKPSRSPSPISSSTPPPGAPAPSGPPGAATPPPPTGPVRLTTLGGRTKTVDPAEVAAFLASVHSSTAPPSAPAPSAEGGDGHRVATPPPGPTTAGKGQADFSWGAGASLSGKVRLPGLSSAGKLPAATTEASAQPPSSSAVNWGTGMSLSGRRVATPPSSEKVPSPPPPNGVPEAARNSRGALVFGSAKPLPPGTKPPSKPRSPTPPPSTPPPTSPTRPAASAPPDADWRTAGGRKLAK